MFCWNTDGNYEWTAGRVKWKSLNFTNSGNVWNIFIRKKNKHLGRARQIYLVFKGNVLWAPSPIWPLLFLPKSLGWVLFCSSPPHKEVPTHPVHCFTLWKPGLFSCWHPGWTQEAHFLATKIEHIRGSQFMYNRVKNSHNFRSTGSFTEEQVETMLEKKQRFGEIMPFAATWTDLEIIMLSEVSLKGRISHDITHVGLKIWHKWTYLWKRHTDIENRLVFAQEVPGGMDWESGISRCELLCGRVGEQGLTVWQRDRVSIQW